MPEVLGNPPSPRAALFWNGTAWQWALVDAAGRLQIDVVDAAGLQDALQSVAADRVIVRGEDQLHSYSGVLARARTAAISGVNGFCDSDQCVAGDVWILTSVAVRDVTSPVTAVEMLVRHDGGNYRFHNEVVALPATTWYTIQCHKWIDEDDSIRVYLPGALAGDTINVEITGQYMTLEA